MTTPWKPDANEDDGCGELEAILAEYMLRADRGEVIDREQFIAEHPEQGDGLRSYFADLDMLQCCMAGEDAAQPAGPQTTNHGPPPDVIRYFGDYELLGELGRGGMGVVYLARQVSLRRLVAVKMILAPLGDDPSRVERFRAEAAAAGNLKHPRIVAIHEVGEHRGQHYFSMDYIPGRSLADIVREQPLPARQAARYMKAVAEAIHYAHQQGIIHRDVKPSNVLVDQRDEPHVTDFGLSKRLEGGISLTQGQQRLGTPGYMPPEQVDAQHAEIGPWSDVYSLGATLYDVLTGRPPFRAENIDATYRQILTQEPVSPRLLNPALHPDLATICLKCLEKEPARRYSSAQDLVEELDRFLANRPILARPVGRLERTIRWSRRNPVVAALAAAVLLMTLVATVVTIVGNVRLSKALAFSQQETRDKQESLTEAQRERDRADRETYASQIHLAYQKWLAGEVVSAENLLDACPRELRHWEWAHLKHLCSLELLTIRAPDSSAWFMISADGARVASSGGVWDAASGLKVMTFPERYRSAHSRDLSDDGKWVALGCHAFGTAVWNLGERKQRLALDVSAVALALSAGGEYLAVAYVREEQVVVAIYDTASGTRVSSFDADAQCLDFSPDATRLAVGLKSGQVQVWDILAKSQMATLPGHAGPVVAVAFSADGSRIATGGADRTAHVWDLATAKAIVTVPDHVAAVHEVRFLADNTQLLSISRGSAKLSALDTGRLLFSTIKHANIPYGMIVQLEPQPGSDAPTAQQPKDADRQEYCGMPADMAMSPDGKKIAWSDYRLIHVRNLVDGSELTYRGHEAAVTQVRFTPDGKRLISAGRDQTIKFWDADRDRAYHDLPGRGNALAYSPDSRWIITEDAGVIKLWSTDTGMLQRQFDVTDMPAIAPGALDYYRPARIVSFAFSPSGRYFVCQGTSGVRIFSVSADAPVWQYDGDYVQSATFSPDEAVLVLQEHNSDTFTDHQFSLWSLATGEKTATLAGRFAGFCAGGAELVGTCGDKAYLADVATGRELGVVSVPGIGKAKTSVISRDGRRGLFRSDSGDCLEWAIDFSTGQKFLLSGTDGVVTSFQLDAPGNRAFTAGLEERLLAWDMQSGRVTSRMVTNDDKDAHRAFAVDGTQLGIPGWDTLLLAMNPDGDRLAAISSRSPVLRIVETTQARELLAIQVAPARLPKLFPGNLHVAFRPDGSQVAIQDHYGVRLLRIAGTSVQESAGDETAAWDRQVFGYDQAPYTEQNPLDEARFVQAGSAFVAHDRDRVIVARDTTTGRVLWELTPGRSSRRVPDRAAYSGDGTRIAFCTEDDLICLLDTSGMPSPPRQTYLRSRPGDERIDAVAIDGDASVVVARHDGGEVTVWDVNTGVSRRFSPPKRPEVPNGPESLDFETHAHRSFIEWNPWDLFGCSSHGKLVWSTDDDEAVHVWSAAEPQPILTLPSIDTPFVVSQDGVWVAYSEAGSGIQIWDVEQRRVRLSIPVSDAHVDRLQASPDGRTVLVFTGSEASTGEDAHPEARRARNRLRLSEHVRLRCYDVSSGDEVLNVGDSPTVVACSPDGKYLAYGVSDGTVQVVELAARQVTRTFHGHGGPVTSVVFSRDGKRIASGSEDGEVVVRGLDTDDASRLRLRGHKAPVCALEFDRDANRLASFSTDDRCNVWDLTNDRDPPRKLRQFPTQLRFPDAAQFPKPQEEDVDWEHSGFVRVMRRYPAWSQRPFPKPDLACLCRTARLHSW